MTAETGLTRLALEVRRRQADLQLTKQQAAVAAGLSTTTWTKIEQGRAVQVTKYAGVDRALKWPIGRAYALATDNEAAANRPGETAAARSGSRKYELPPGLTDHQRDLAAAAGEAAAQAVAQELLRQAKEG